MLCENQNDHCYHNVFPFQIVKLMKHIVAASSHVLGNKNVDEGDDFSFFSGLFTFYKLNCIPKLFGFKASVHLKLLKNRKRSTAATLYWMFPLSQSLHITPISTLLYRCSVSHQSWVFFCHPQTLLLSFLNRDPEQCGHADETVCPAALCRLPSGCDLTSWRAAGQT